MKEQPIKEQMIDIEQMRIREESAEFENPFDFCEVCGEVILGEDLEYVDDMKVHNFCQDKCEVA